MGEIMINGVPFHFDEMDISYDNSEIIDKEKAKRNLFDFKRVMDEHNMLFYIMHGTLLGAVREHDFIPFDIDIDTCVLDEEALIEMIPALDAAGLKLCRYETNTVYSFIRDGVYIDVYIVNRINGLAGLYYVRYIYNKIMPKKFFRGYTEIDFLGGKFKAPNHVYELMEYWYGKDWRTPKPNTPSDSRSKLGQWLFKYMHILFRPLFGKK